MMPKHVEIGVTITVTVRGKDHSTYAVNVLEILMGWTAVATTNPQSKMRNNKRVVNSRAVSLNNDCLRLIRFRYWTKSVIRKIARKIYGAPTSSLDVFAPAV
jgi:hypothetical protein